MGRHEAAMCPCGECSNWLVKPEAYLQGVGFDREQAELVAQVLDDLDDERAARREPGPPPARELGLLGTCCNGKHEGEHPQDEQCFMFLSTEDEKLLITGAPRKRG